MFDFLQTTFLFRFLAVFGQDVGANLVVPLGRELEVKNAFEGPAGDFQADGERTGEYILGGEELTLNSKGESVISYADYAVAMIDEAVSGNHIQERISVVGE